MKTFIWGASGHAKIVADILRVNGHEIVGFIDDKNPARKGEAFFQSYVLGGRDELDKLRQQAVTSCVIAFGDNNARMKAAETCLQYGFSLATAVHPAAILASDVKVGRGTVIAAGVVVNAASRIGENVILNTQANIDHDCTVEDGAHIGPGANLAGAVHVGRCAWIGIGASIIDHRQIGADSVVGAGAVVLKDVPAGITVAGVPARLLRAPNDRE